MRHTALRLWATTAAELHGLRREKTALFFMFVLPIVLVFILGVAFGEAGERAAAGFVDESESSASQALMRSLRDNEAVGVKMYESRADLTDAVVRQAVAFGVVIPPSYAAELASGRDLSMTVISTAGGGDIALVQSSLGSAVSRQVVVATAARVASEASGVPLETSVEVAAEIAKEARLAGVTRETVAGEVLVGGTERVAYTSLVLFLVITGLTSAGTFTELRRNHVAQRLLAVPAPTAELELGLVSARFLTVMAQALYIVLVTAWLFQVDWGNLVATTLVALSLGIAVAGMSALAGTIYTTPEQAGAIGAPIGIALGMLGGAMWPLEIVPVPLQVIGHLLPTAWAVDAFNDIVGNGAGVRDVMPEIGVILGMAAALFALAGLRLRRVFSV